MANANPSFSSGIDEPQGNKSKAKVIINRPPSATELKNAAGEDRPHAIVENNESHIKTQLRSGTVKTVRK